MGGNYDLEVNVKQWLLLKLNSFNKKVKWGNGILIDNKKLTEILLDYCPNFKCVVTHDYVQVLKLNYSVILSNPKIFG